MYNKLGRIRLFLSRHVGGGALVPAVVIFHHRANYQAAALLQMEPETFRNWKLRKKVIVKLALSEMLSDSELSQLQYTTVQ